MGLGKMIASAANYAMYGMCNPRLVCPHCGVVGKVYTKTVQAKRGISGGKATGAVLTGGLSLFATGLSQKVSTTQANCKNCYIEWMI